MKNVIVTGAANGIGKVTAQQLRDLGWSVYGLDKVAVNSGMRDYEGITWLQANLANAKDIVDVIDQLNGVTFHGLVNNAAEIVGSPWEEFNFDEWELAISANLTAPLRLCHGLRHQFAAGASIVNVSSQGACHAAYASIPYTLTKAAQINLTQSLAANFGPQGVRVNAVMPGWVTTESAKPFIPKITAEITPLGRVAEPGEIADAIVFLLSEQSRFISGTQLVVDGGYSAIDYSMYVLDSQSHLQ